jgi:hypothetical protein
MFECAMLKSILGSFEIKDFAENLPLYQGI